MKNSKIIIFGSLATFFIGTSCCWLSSLLIWLGGATFFGAAVTFVENIYVRLILLSILLILVVVFIYRRKVDTSTLTRSNERLT